jgi:hypothetical protein
MLKRRRHKFLHVRDPDWRREVLFRAGMPMLGALVAIMFALAISQL